MNGQAPARQLFVRAVATLPPAVQEDVRRRHAAHVARLLEQGAARLAVPLEPQPAQLVAPTQEAPSMSTLVSPTIIVARKACGCVVASTAEHPSIAPAIRRDVAAWERMGLTVGRVPRRELHTLPWASLGDGWCLHNPPRPTHVPGAPGGGALLKSVAYAGRRVGRHLIPSTAEDTRR